MTYEHRAHEALAAAEECSQWVPLVFQLAKALVFAILAINATLSAHPGEI